ncbi:MAG: tetratricopeptide repeat protein [bacterium]
MIKENIIYSIIFLLFFTIFNLQGQGDSRQKFEYAKTFEQSGDFETAARIYKELFESNQKNEDYFNGYVRTSKALNKFSEVLPVVESFMKNKKSVALYVLYAELLWRTGSNDLANENWKKAINLEPINQETYKQISKSQIELLQYGKAATTLEEGRKALNNSKIYADELCQLYIATGDFKKGTEEALIILNDTKNIALAQGRITALLTIPAAKAHVQEVLEDAVSGNRENYLNLKVYSWFLRYIGNLEKAFEVIKRMDEATNAQGRDIIGFANDSKNDGQYDIALKAFEHIIKMGNKSKFLSSALYGYPRTLEQKLLTDSSISIESAKSIIESYREIIKQFPKDMASAEARFRIALISYEQLSDEETAKNEIENINRQFSRQKVTASALNLLAKIHLLKEENDTASKIYDNVIRNFEKIAPEEVLFAKYNLAEMKFFVGDIDTAKILFSELSVQTNKDLANDALGRVILIEQNKEMVRGLGLYAKAIYLEKQKKYNEAINKLLETEKVSKGTNLAERSLINAAEISLKIALYDSSLAIANQLILNYPKSIYIDHALILNGNCYEKKGERDKAIESYRQLITDFPRSVYLQEARNKIRILREGNNL